MERSASRGVDCRVGYREESNTCTTRHQQLPRNPSWMRLSRCNRLVAENTAGGRVAGRRVESRSRREESRVDCTVERVCLLMLALVWERARVLL